MKIKAFIQNQKGSKLRYKYNEETLIFLKTEELLSPALYQYGFIPGTLVEDRDCIDIWLVSKHEYDVGTLVDCKARGIIEMFEEYQGERENDFKIIVSPENEDSILIDLVFTEIKNFTWEIFKAFPEVKVTFGKLLSADAAEKFISKNYK